MDNLQVKRTVNGILTVNSEFNSINGLPVKWTIDLPGPTIEDPYEQSYELTASVQAGKTSYGVKSRVRVDSSISIDVQKKHLLHYAQDMMTALFEKIDTDTAESNADQYFTL